MTRTLYLLASVLGPLAVLTSSALWLGRPKDELADLSEAAVVLRDRLAADPEVVIVGNSAVHRGIDREMLAEGLSVEGVQTLSVPASRPPTWYAVLKNRVYGDGHNPRLVIVGGTLDWFLDDGLYTALDRQRLLDQMGAEEPLIDERIFGAEAGHPMLVRARERRLPLRNGVLNWARDVAVGLFFRSPGQGLLVGGNTRAEAALGAVFSDSTVDLTLQNRVIPVVELERGLRQETAQTPVKESFLISIADLVREQGDVLLVVRMPVAPSNPVATAEDFQAERALVMALNERGSGYLDLRRVAVESSQFSDPMHLNASGQRVFTAALVSALKEVGALSTEALAPNPLPSRPPVVSREGSPPSLELEAFRREDLQCHWRIRLPELQDLSDSFLRRGARRGGSPLVLLEDGYPLVKRFEGPPRELGAEECEGAFMHWGGLLYFSPSDETSELDESRYSLAFREETSVLGAQGRQAWWGYPGTSLRFELDLAEMEGSPGGLVGVRAEHRGGGESPPLLRVDGTVSPMRRVGMTWVGTVESSPEGETWRLDIESPEDGPYLLLADVVMGEQTILTGASGQVSARLIKPGKWLEVEPVYQERPLGIGALDPPFHPAGELGRFSMPDYGIVSNAAVYQASGFFQGSPLQVLEDGEPLPLGGVGCHQVRQEGMGRYCHDGDKLLFAATDGSEPGGQTHEYSLRLDPERGRRGGYWIYPADSARFGVSEQNLRRFPAGTDTLALGAAVFGEPTGSLNLRMEVDGEVTLEAEVSLADLAAGPLTLSFDMDVQPESLSVVVETAEGSAWVFLTNMSVARSPLAEQPLP